MRKILLDRRVFQVFNNLGCKNKQSVHSHPGTMYSDLWLITAAFEKFLCTECYGRYMTFGAAGETSAEVDLSDEMAVFGLLFLCSKVQKLFCRIVR